MVKISELIEKLQKIQKVHGDIYFISPEFDSWGHYDVEIPEQINLHNARIENKHHIITEDSSMEKITACSITSWMSEDDENKRVLFEHKRNEGLKEVEQNDILYLIDNQGGSHE